MNQLKLRTTEDVLGLGQILAKSGYFSDAREASQAVVKILAGREIGLGPIAAMAGIYVVKGRITLGANIIAGLVRSHPRYDYRVVRLDAEVCEIEFLAANGDVLGLSRFSLEDARRAGLAQGDNWQKHPRNMLFARAVSNGAKWFCPDVFNGNAVYTSDEMKTDEPAVEPPDAIEPTPQSWVEAVIAPHEAVIAEAGGVIAERKARALETPPPDFAVNSPSQLLILVMAETEEYYQAISHMFYAMRQMNPAFAWPHASALAGWWNCYRVLIARYQEKLAHSEADRQVAEQAS